MKKVSAEERLLREVFSEPTVFGHIADRLTRDWTDAELGLNAAGRKHLSLRKRMRIHVAQPFARVDSFIRQHRPRKNGPVA